MKSCGCSTPVPDAARVETGDGNQTRVTLAQPGRAVSTLAQPSQGSDSVFGGLTYGET